MPPEPGLGYLLRPTRGRVFPDGSLSDSFLCDLPKGPEERVSYRETGPGACWCPGHHRVGQSHVTLLRGQGVESDHCACPYLARVAERLVLTRSEGDELLD